MKLESIVSEQKLVKIVLDDEEIRKEFGDALEFYTPDRQPLDVYLELSSAMDGDKKRRIKLLADLMLTEDGDKIICLEEGKKPRIPKAAIMVKAMTAVMEMLGK